MQITVDVRAAEVLRGLALTEKQVDYAIVNALNATAKTAQAAERARLSSVFHVRKREFVERQVAVIRPFASVSQGRYFVQISVGQKPRLLLSGFESGAPRPPFKGKHVAVPLTGSPARPTASSSVPTSFTFQGLRLIRAGKTRSGRSRRGRATSIDFKSHVTGRGALQFKGQQRTFLLTQTRVAPFGGVFQRVGPGRGDIRMIYSFRDVPALRPVLGFMRTMQETSRTMFPGALRGEIDRSITRTIWKNFSVGAGLFR